MDALITLIGTATALVLFGALSATFGSDSREGFAEPTVHLSFR